MVRRATVAAAALFAALIGVAGPLAAGVSQGAPNPADATRTPSATPADTPTATPPSTSGDGDGVGDSAVVEVAYGSLPVNATLVYRRVEQLTGVDAPAPTVEVLNYGPVDLSVPFVSPLSGALGYRTGAGNGSSCGTFYPASYDGTNVSISPGNLSAAAVELTLVHEFAHVVQAEVEGYARVRSQHVDVARTLLEGSAVYVADAYARAYGLRWNGSTPLGVRECLYERVPGLRRYGAGSYFFGGRYFDRRLESPRDLASAYGDPPRTMEQVIHGREAAEDPPANLSVTVADGPDWTGTDPWRAGELELRSWLRIGLPADRVDVAASGWGNDALVPFERPNGTGAAWVLRMDAPTDADELEAAVADLGAALEARNATTVRSERVGNETVVAFAGSASFVRNATADGTDGNVTVTAP